MKSISAIRTQRANEFHLTAGANVPAMLLLVLLLFTMRVKSQYCNTALTNGNYCGNTAYITNVTILNTFLNHSSWCSYAASNGNYMKFQPGLGTTASLIQGATYSIQITTALSAIESVWIDFNNDHTFSSSEWFQPTISSVANVPTTATFVVSSSAVTGTTGLRVRTRNATTTNGSGDACTSFSSGETEDYIITIVPASTCTNVPANAITSPTAFCPGMGTSVSFTNLTVNPGLSFQWYSSSVQVGPYSAVAGATLPAYNTGSLSTSAPTWYMGVISCPSASLSTTVTAVMVAGSYSFPDDNCYCNSAGSFNLNDKIQNVMLNGNQTNGTYSFGNSCLFYPPGPGTLPGRYSNFKTLGSLANVMTGAVNTFSVYQAACATNMANGLAAWIDFNQDGDFTDPGEQIYSENSLSTGPRKILTGFTPPPAALPGVTVMRVTVATGITGSSLSPCLNYNTGETEDYLVTIVQSTPCSGTPSANVIQVNTPTCPSTGGSLSFINPSNSYTAGGLSYQWFSGASQSGTFTAINGATLPVYFTGPMTGLSPTWYMATITCTNSSSSATLSAQQVTNTLADCYCPSASLNSSNQKIFNVTMNGNSTNPAYSFTNGCATPGPGPGSVLGRYANYKTLGAFTSVYAGALNTFSVMQDECDGPSYYANYLYIWIDFNQNGSFTDPGEMVYSDNISQPSPHNAAGTFSVPLGAPSGTTGMRVIVSNATVAPCSNPLNGETEDYLVDVIYPPACSGSPAGSPVAVTNPTVCAGEQSGLSLSPVSYSNTGIQFQWFSSSVQTGPYSLIPGATSFSYIATAPNTAMYYMATITCTNGAAPSTSTSVSSVQVYSTLINPIPYLETFEGITFDNDLPNCQWQATNLGNATRTYFVPVSSGWNQVNHTPSGNKYASFTAGYNNSAFFTNAFQLQPGITYSASVWYISSGLPGWQNLSIGIGASQSVSGMITVAVAPSPTNTVYSQLGGTLTVPNSGLYYLAINGGNTAINGFVTIDDIELTIPCSVNPVTSVNSSTNSICTGDQVNLSLSVATGSSAVSGYTWNTGPQNTSIVVNPTVITSYSVVSTSTANCTGSNISSITITVNPNPTISVNSGSVCSANPVFTIIPSGAGPGGSYAISGGNTVVNPSATNSYTVSGTSQHGCPSANIAVATVSVYTTPTVKVSSFTICTGDSVDIAPTGASTYIWYTGTATGSNFTVSSLTNTSFSVVGISAEGCQSAFGSAVSTVSVNLTPTLGIANGLVCYGQPFTFTPTGCFSYTVNGTPVAGNTFSVLPANVGSHSFVVTGTGTNNCMSKVPATGILTVVAIPTIVANNATICSGESAVLSFTGTGTTGNYTLINGTNTVQPSGGIYSVMPTSTTSYSVMGINSDGCAGTAILAVNVNPLPQIFLLTSNGKDSLCQGESVTLTASGADSYTFMTGSQVLSLQPTVGVMPASSTVFTIIAIDLNGCLNTTTFTQKVVKCTGLRDHGGYAENLSVFPNPTHGEIVVRLNNNEEKVLELSDVTGRILFSETTDQENTTIKMSELANGVYYLNVKTARSGYTVKVVKQ